MQLIIENLVNLDTELISSIRFLIQLWKLHSKESCSSLLKPYRSELFKSMYLYVAALLLSSRPFFTVDDVSCRNIMFSLVETLLRRLVLLTLRSSLISMRSFLLARLIRQRPATASRTDMAMHIAAGRCLRAAIFFEVEEVVVIVGCPRDGTSYVPANL